MGLTNLDTLISCLLLYASYKITNAAGGRVHKDSPIHIDTKNSCNPQPSLTVRRVHVSCASLFCINRAWL